MSRSDRSGPRRSLRNRRGVIILLVAFLLPVLLIVVGFSVDLANLQRARTELRAVADLSAKAAAGELSRTQDGAKAIAAAKSVASRNFVAGETLTLEDQDIVFGHSARQAGGNWLFQPQVTPFNSIRVNARRTADAPEGPLRPFFGQFYGRQNTELQFAATSSFLDVDICLVLDRSSSMKLDVGETAGFMNSGDSRFCFPPEPGSRWLALDSAVGLFINHLTSTLASEHVSLVTFGSDYTSCGGVSNVSASTDQTLDADLSLITTAMAARSNSVWNGATNIDAGIRQGRGVLNSAQARPFATRYLIVLTDGVYTGADPVPEAASALQDGIVVHAITFSEGANQADMQDVAQAGGGQHYHAPDAAALEGVFLQIAGAVAILTE